MDSIFNDIKSFIVSSVNDYIEEESTQEIPLDNVTAGNVILGQVDLQKYKSNIVVAVVPESQNDEENEIGYYEQQSHFVVSFICRGATSEKLAKKMCAYARAFKRAIHIDSSLGDTVDDTQIGDANFFLDAGSIDGQLAAVEIDITVFTSTEYDD